MQAVIKSETGFETNVFENYQNPLDAWSTQHWLRLYWQRSRPHNTLHLRSLSGFSFYPQYAAENKCSQTLAIRQLHRFSGTLSGQLKTDFFYKTWIQERDHRYFTLKAEYNFLHSARALEISWGPILHRNRYRFEKQFHSDQYGVQLSGQRHCGPHWVLLARFQYSYIDYPHRPVFQLEQYSQTPTLQRDHLFLGKIGFEFHDHRIFGISLRLLRLTSNSSYVDYWGYALHFYGTQRFGQTIVQLIAQLYIKDYSQELLSHLIAYYPDPEQNVQNQLLIGWERPIGQKRLSLTGKAAFMRNESRYSGIYYEKWLVTLGLQYRLR